MADDRVALPAAYGGGQAVPRADRLRLQPTPGHPHQVQRSQEVREPDAEAGQPLEPNRELETRLTQILASHGVRSERLLDGSRVLLLDAQLGSSEQVLAAGQCVLSVRKLLPDAPVVVCTGRAVVEGRLPIGDLLERSARLLASTPPG